VANHFYFIFFWGFQCGGGGGGGRGLFHLFMYFGLVWFSIFGGVCHLTKSLGVFFLIFKLGRIGSRLCKQKPSYFC
jgi:hypothetical protein